ncbi:hypothetical protein N005_14375 [Pseudomonas mediterranea CFBP 5447]|jgi:hypothetical protein|nr:hypothetical protein N005_14375 [Pseudomonas mediterranea CFBP 5447]
MFIVLRERRATGGLEQGLLQDTDGRFLEQVLLRMRNGDQSRLGRVLEMMVAAPNPHQVPTVRDELAYQKSAIHITSMWCAWWVLYLL